MAGNGAYRWADRTFLRSDQYSTESKLCARQSIYAHQQPHLELAPLVLDLAIRSGDEVVVDVGCGNGAYLAELARRRHHGFVVGVDLSRGMLEAAHRATPAAHLATADACALPLRDACADLALAMHMLYHVLEPARAVDEMRRVLTPGGRLVVVLNAEDHLGELGRAVRKARQELGLGAEAFGSVWGSLRGRRYSGLRSLP